MYLLGILTCLKYRQRDPMRTDKLYTYSLLFSLVSVLTSVGTASLAHAEQVNTATTQDTSAEEPITMLPVPTIITEPAVGAGLGGAMLFFHDSDENKNVATSDTPMMPTGITLVGGAYTRNKSMVLGFGHIGYWQQDTVRYKGFVGYGDINLDFYSVAGIDLANPIKLNLKGPAMLQTLSWRINDSNWFVGAKQTFRHVDIGLAESPFKSYEGRFFDELNSILEQLELENNTSGLGLIAEYDSTDSPFDPEKGYNYHFEYLVFDDAIGSDTDYHSYILSGLNYWHLGDKTRMGLRVDYEGVRNQGDTALPVYVLPFIDLRGIPKSRYQGEDVIVAEAELSYHLTPDWKVLGFSGIGKAANSWGDLNDASSRVTFGAGFRYLVSQRYGVRMGIDVAHGPEENAFYIQAGSSW